MATLFERAEALGVFAVDNDYAKLAEAIHERETELMLLRHDLELRIAGIIAQKVD